MFDEEEVVRLIINFLGQRGTKTAETIWMLVEEVGIPVGNITLGRIEMVKGKSTELRGWEVVGIRLAWFALKHLVPSICTTKNSEPATGFANDHVN